MSWRYNIFNMLIYNTVGVVLLRLELVNDKRFSLMPIDTQQWIMPREAWKVTRRWYACMFQASSSVLQDGGDQHLLMASAFMAARMNHPSSLKSFTQTRSLVQGMCVSHCRSSDDCLRLACSFSPWSLPGDPFNQTPIYFVINFNWWLYAIDVFYCLL